MLRRRLRSSQLARMKALFCLFICTFLVMKTIKIFQDMYLGSTKNALMRQLQKSSGRNQESSGQNPESSDAHTNVSCKLTERLGLSKYVAYHCPPEGHLPCSKLTCANLLFSGNTSIYKTARAFMKLLGFPRLQDEDFVNLTRDCASFRLERGYEQKMQNVYEDFPIAFNLIVHKDVEQIERLIYALYRPKNRFCIHLDLKSSPVMQAAIEGITRCLPNVFMASQKADIYWGDYNRLLADIYCMRDHVQSKSDWRYLINQAGQAFPLRSMHEMVEILKIYNGSNDIEGMTGSRVIKKRFRYEFKRVNGTYNVERMIGDKANGVRPKGGFYDSSRNLIVMKEPKVRHPDPPFDLDIVRGSTYGIFSRKFVEYVVSDRRAQEFLEWSRGTFSPDEFYWATLHHTFSNPHFHPPGGYSGDPNTKPWMAVYVNWMLEPCSGYQRHGICVFGVEDLPSLVGRREFFVNKFDTGFEPMALECLRMWIDYKESCTGLQQLDVDFYKSLPFVKKN